MLKRELLAAYELTEAQRAVKLLHLPDLREKLPSALAAEIIALVPRGVTPGYLECQIFLEQLPQSLQAHMAAHTDVTELRQLAKTAEQYMASPSASSSGSSFAVMGPQHSPPDEPPQRPLGCGNSAAPPCCGAIGSQSQICSYHRRFGAVARQCQGPPCSQKKQPPGKANAGRR